MSSLFAPISLQSSLTSFFEKKRIYILPESKHEQHFHTDIYTNLQVQYCEQRCIYHVAWSEDRKSYGFEMNEGD